MRALRGSPGIEKSFTMSKIFLDTNILIYTLDTHDLRKQDHCRSLLRTIQNKNNGVISTQIMQEFYVVATKKLSVKPQIAKNILHSFENFEVVQINPPLIQQAIDCSIIHQLSFWDALIIVCAEGAKCDQLWTEDLNSGQVIRGVKIENPINMG